MSCLERRSTVAGTARLDRSARYASNACPSRCQKPSRAGAPAAAPGGSSIGRTLIGVSPVSVLLPRICAAWGMNSRRGGERRHKAGIRALTKLNRLNAHAKLSQQQTKAADAGRICGTVEMACRATASLRRAATNALKTASANTSWLASAMSSSSSGKFGCRDSEQCHSPSSSTMRRSFHRGISSSMRSIAASVQAAPAINRSRRAAAADLLSAGSRGHAQILSSAKRSNVRARASRSFSSNRSSRTAGSAANATTQSLGNRPDRPHALKWPHRP